MKNVFTTFSFFLVLTTTVFAQNVGIGVPLPTNTLDIQRGSPRFGGHAFGRPLYVTGDLGQDTNGIEFRDNNGTQGIGFGYNTIYAAGTLLNHDLGFKAKGSAGNLKFITGNIERIRIQGNGNVGVGTVTPDSSAVLDVTSTSKGILIPRMTTVQRDMIVSPAVGLQILNLDDQCVDIYDGTSWKKNCGMYVVDTIALPSRWRQRENVGGNHRTEAVGFSIGSMGYIGLGSTDQTSDFWEYNSTTNTWTQKANFGGSPRKGAVGFAIGNKGIIGFGFTTGSGYQKDFWEFDPENNHWDPLPVFPGEKRDGAIGFSIGNVGYVGTGYTGSAYLRDFWKYQSGLWLPLDTFDGPARSNAIAVVANGVAYVGTGKLNSNYLIDFYKYNPGNDTWTVQADFGGVARQNAVGFSISNKVYIGIGDSYPVYHNDFWKFIPDSGMGGWTQEIPFPGGARTGAVAFSIGNIGYVGTGILFQDQKKDFWEFRDQSTGPIYNNAVNVGNAYALNDGIWIKKLENASLELTGNVGIGISNPLNKIDINAGNNPRNGSHPSGLPFYLTGGLSLDDNVMELKSYDGLNGIGFGYNSISVVGDYPFGDISLKAKGTIGSLIFSTNGLERMRIFGDGKLYVTGDIGSSNGFEFRHSDETQGIGFGFNTIYATGSLADQDLGLKARGTGGDLNFITNNLERMRIQGNGSVGIGTSSPLQKLHVVGNTIISDKLGIGLNTPNAPLQFGNAVANRKIVLYESQNNDHEFYGFGINGSILRYQVPPGTNHVFYAGVDAANSIELMRIKANGNVGIGISVPTEKLHVNGNGLFTGTVTASCGLLICSDMRYKIKATALNNALQKVMALNGIYYYWDKEHFPEKNFTDDRQVGVSAQELETVLPELVHTDADGYKTVDYSRLTPVLIEAVKEQQRQIEELKQQVKMLVELMTPSSSVKSE